MENENSLNYYDKNIYILRNRYSCYNITIIVLQLCKLGLKSKNLKTLGIYKPKENYAEGHRELSWWAAVRIDNISIYIIYGCALNLLSDGQS